MKPLYTSEEFTLAKSTDLLPLECVRCSTSFLKPKKEINYELKNNRGAVRFCSISCSSLFNKPEKRLVSCINCDNQFLKRPSHIERSSNHFCSRSCAATYNNKHKTTGNRRSKLEVYLEEQLTSLYPELNILFNKKEAIGSELDIFIPSLQLAFELNGIFHYEPIYGSEKLNQIQSNDSNKFQKCQELGISLCIIDTSQQKYFKESTSKKYLDIITSIINQRTTLLTI